LQWCADITDLTEYDLLQFLEKGIEIHKDEEDIENFVRDTPSGDVYGLYKLKTKVMQEKLDRLKEEFDEKAAEMGRLKQMLEEQLRLLQ